MKTTFITLFILFTALNVSAQGWMDDDQPDRGKMRQRVEDLRQSVRVARHARTSGRSMHLDLGDPAGGSLGPIPEVRR